MERELHHLLRTYGWTFAQWHALPAWERKWMLEYEHNRRSLIYKAMKSLKGRDGINPYGLNAYMDLWKELL